VTRTIETYTLEIGALHRKQIKVRLDQLGLHYVEHRGLVESIIIVQVFNDAEERALHIFKREFLAFVRRLQAIDAEIENEKFEREYQIEKRKLARKNRWRRLTFRKPLTRFSK
jgi:hypothetical protein